MSKKRKEIKPAHSTYDLGDGFELTFITGQDSTSCYCEPLDYEKLVARHPGAKDLDTLHESLKYLFPQYVEDAKRQVNLAVQ